MRRTADSQLVLTDRALPGLSTVLDEEAFHELIRSVAPDMPENPPKIEYVHYRPGRYCNVAYSYEFDERRLYLYAKAFSKRSMARVDQTNPPLLLNESIVSDFVWHDKKLRGVSKLQPAGFQENFLERLFPKIPELWNCKWKPLRYIPEGRFVTQFATQNNIKAAVKFYSVRRFAAADRKTFHSGELLRVPRRIGRRRTLHVIAYEWLQGRLLRDALTDGLHESRLQSIGVALGEMHSQKRICATRLPLVEQGRTLMALARKVTVLCPELSVRVSRLATAMSESLLELQENVGPLHGDFNPSQIVLTQSGIGVIDFDRAAFGDPALDLGNFLAHLQLYTLYEKLDRNKVEVFSHELLTGYSLRKKLPSMKKIKLYTSVNLFRLLTEPFRFHERCYPERLEAILGHSEKLFKGPI